MSEETKETKETKETRETASGDLGGAVSRVLARGIQQASDLAYEAAAEICDRLGEEGATGAECATAIRDFARGLRERGGA